VTTLPTTTTTAVPDIVEVPRPENVGDERFVWFTHPASGGHSVLMGVLRSAAPLPHPAMLVVHSSVGLAVDNIRFAEELAARGFDVVIGCWFAPHITPDIEGQVIPCTDAPPYQGVVDAAVPDLDALVEAARHALGPDRDLAILGASRGAGIAALRATTGAPEPLVLVSGLYEGWNAIGSPPGNEANVVERAAGVRAPIVMFHGIADGAVPVVQAEHLEAALRAAGVEVDAAYYEGAGHNLLGIPDVHTDVLERFDAFLCARFTCAGRV
jgi:dienelactone hydrolase